QSTSSSESSPVPSGWTDEILCPDVVKTMLIESTGLKADKIELAEVRGSHYIFVSDKDHYVWNTVNEERARVVNPKGRDALFCQIAKGAAAALELEPLENLSDLEQ
ncbi:hypothetical protein DFH29DRAFT_806810, partial [Suillus ampliporus]